MNDYYKMLGIDLDGHNSKYGDVYVVDANPAIESWGSYSYTTSLCEETEHFMFVRDPHMKRELDEIGYSRELWHPSPTEFKDERVIHKETGRIITMHIHRSLWDEEYIERRKQRLSVNVPEYKRSELLEQYHEKYGKGYWGEYRSTTFQDFVSSSCVENKDDFLAWLFDDDSLKGITISQISDNHFRAIQRFVEACKDIR